MEKTNNISLPYHLIKKEWHGKPVLKRETFIFDLLRYAEGACAILYPRELIFAPLKRREDIEAVQHALLERDRRAFVALSGKEPIQKVFELEAQFHYPTDKLKKKWKRNPLPIDSFILS